MFCCEIGKKIISLVKEKPEDKVPWGAGRQRDSALEFGSVSPKLTVLDVLWM